jgi:hypothetical protein
MGKLKKASIAAAVLVVALVLTLEVGALASRPPYAFDGAYAMYQMNVKIGNFNFTGQVRYQVSDVNLKTGTFVVSFTYYGNVSDFLGYYYVNGTNTTSTFSNLAGFPALNSTTLAELNAGHLLAGTAANVTDTTRVVLVVPAGKYVTDEVNFGGGSVDWFDQKTGLIVNDVGSMGPDEPISFLLISTNVKPLAPSYLPYEYLAVVLAIAAVVTAVVAYAASRGSDKKSEAGTAQPMYDQPQAHLRHRSRFQVRPAALFTAEMARRFSCQLRRWRQV